MTLNATILYEDNHLLVVVKPSMLPTQGAVAGTDSLVDQLRDYIRRKYKKPGNAYLGVVSRLDSWVSGVIIFARTSKAAERLNEQFRMRSCQKSYLAIIPDQVDFPSQGRLNDFVVKSESTQRMVVVPKNSSVPNSKLASLSYQTLGQSNGQRLLGIELETGRKHQIRVQLSAAGCPILGDQKYGSEITFPTGIALHSHQLQIIHPTTKRTLNFKAAPPAYWRLDRFGFDAEVG